MKRGGVVNGNSLQSYQVADESIQALQVSLSVIDHNLPGVETQAQPQWQDCNPPSLTLATTQLQALTAILLDSASRLSSKGKSRNSRFPALLWRLYNKGVRDPLAKLVHRIWWEGLVELCKAAQDANKWWPDSHDLIIQQMVNGWEAPDWPQGLADLRYICDQSHLVGGQHQKSYRLQPMAWHSQVKAGQNLIRSISQLRRHLP